MSGNALGQCFVVSTAGESHGPALVTIVDGCPPGLALSETDIQPRLDRRRPGQSAHTTQRQEPDRVKILSGVFEGKTTGAPIALIIRNQDARSEDYKSLKSVFRPGHADFTYQKKYGHRDHRGGGRASARETASWVAAGAIAGKYLREHCGIKIQGYLAALGDLRAEIIDLEQVDSNAFFFPDGSQLDLLSQRIQGLRDTGDSTGARVNVVASQVPVGLGAPVFSKLDAALAHAMMSINAAKGVEIGLGFDAVKLLGSEYRDARDAQGFSSNRSGGTLGGISSGEPILVSVAFKPTSSIKKRIQTCDKTGKLLDLEVKGRHDPCVGIRAVPIVEAMMALVLMDHYLLDRAQNAEVER